MTYSYFPGCSASETSRPYGESIRVVADFLGMKFVELDDWNCCGATAYMSMRELISFSISARNLSIAEKTGMDLVTPCSSCYTVLRKTDSYLKTFPLLKGKIDRILHSAGLEYGGKTRVRHILEVVLSDIGMKKIKELVTTRLAGLKIAPYYGCQTVRPGKGFDDPEFPLTMDRLVETLGATAVYFPMKARCCGGSLMATEREMALRMTKNILLCAYENRADAIVTTCPLCHMNLDAFQSQINKQYGTEFNMPVLYFTQLMGYAFGLSTKSLGLNRHIVSSRGLLDSAVHKSG